MDELAQRVLIRFYEDEYKPNEEVVGEILLTVSDRLKIRLEVEELPSLADSIIVDASIKALRLRGYEGSRSESAADGGSFSTSFIDDVLDAYQSDIASLKKSLHKSGLKFL